MGLFDFLKKKNTKEEIPVQKEQLTTDVEFKRIKEGTHFTIANQDGQINVESEEELYSYIRIMLDDPDQFVVLCAPKAMKNIRYIQACMVNDEIEVQLGVEEGDTTKLYSKRCEEEELKEIFVAFYYGEFVTEHSQYQPVEFYC